MRITKSLALLTAGVAALGFFGVSASAAAPAPKALGWCAKQSGGGVRMLEPRNVAKSQHGKCVKGETRVLLPTTVAKGPKGDAGPAGVKGDVGPQGPKGDTGAVGPQGVAGVAGKDGKDGAAARGLDGAPFNMTFTGDGPWSCSWKADTSTLACITPAG